MKTENPKTYYYWCSAWTGREGWHSIRDNRGNPIRSLATAKKKVKRWNGRHLAVADHPAGDASWIFSIADNPDTPNRRWHSVGTGYKNIKRCDLVATGRFTPQVP